MPLKMLTWAQRKTTRARKLAVKAKSQADVVKQIQKEAKENGASLKNAGEGGLDPELALEVFRRASFTCQVPGCKTAKQDLDLDHIGGHAHELEQDPKAAAWLKAEAAKGKQNTPEGLHAVCARHHDLFHDRERDIEQGEKPRPMTK